MIKFLRAVSLKVWVVLIIVLILPILSLSNNLFDYTSSSTMLYIVEPLVATAIAVGCYWLIGAAHIRVRHPGEKAFMMAAMICVWFVVYFLSGLVLTFVRNSLVVDAGQTIINILVYGTTAAALEFTRYKVLAASRHKNIMGFGVIVSLVFALTQLPYGQIDAVSSLEESIKIFIASILPAIAASFLLTYLALTSGLGTMLVYRLGMVFIAIVPPIIPNYDWYLIGISSLLLSLVIYIVMDKQIQRQHNHPRKKIQQLKRANDVMFVALIIGLAAFMSGFFSYKPMAILSNSMQPVYSRGAMVVVERVTTSVDIEVGDIVQYQSAGKTLTHRVVAIEAASDGSGNRVFKTKGDNSPSEDPAVSGSQIGGVVKSYIPYVGYPTIWLREAAQ